MKKIKLFSSIITLILIITIVFPSFTNSKDNIIGTWVLEGSSPEYKLTFSNKNICKEYENGILLTTYTYNIEKENCEEYSNPNSLYLKWIDNDDQTISCFEISSTTKETLSLMIIDKGKILFFNKQ